MKMFLILLLLTAGYGGTNAQLPDFCGEPMPATDSVLVKMSRYLAADAPRISYLKRQALLYFPGVETIIQSYGLPSDIKYVALVESAFQMNVESPMQARGPWQFMPQTAQAMGLRLTPIDERDDLIKSTHAACRYFLKLYTTFTNYTLAAAAYNMGPQGLTNQIGQQRQPNYYRLQLNAETAAYVYRILSIKELFERPHRYRHLLNQPDYDLLTQNLAQRLPTVATVSRPVVKKVTAVAFPYDEDSLLVKEPPRQADSLTLVCLFRRDYVVSRQSKLELVVAMTTPAEQEATLYKNDLLIFTIVERRATGIVLQLEAVYSNKGQEQKGTYSSQSIQIPLPDTVYEGQQVQIKLAAG